MGDELKPDFKAEYARSGRSSCKKCGDVIAQGAIRIAKMERSDRFDGEIPVWHHLKCFFQKHGSLVSSFEMIKDADSLRWDDQQKIKKAGGFSEDGAAAAAADDDDEDSEDGGGEVKIEYAKSGRSSCRGCGKFIDNGDVRIGEQYADENSRYQSYEWHHIDCWEVSSSIKKVTDIVGYSKLKAADKKTVKEAIDEGIKAITKKRKEVEKSKKETDSKKAKVDDEAKKRADAMWKIKDTLTKKKYSNNELKAMLKFNDQSVYGGPQDLLNRIAWMQLEGVLPRCAECKNGHLHYEEGKIKCHGHLSAWSKCTFQTDLNDTKVVRGTWKNPSAEQIDELIEEMKDDKAKIKEEAAAPDLSTKSTLFESVVATFIGPVPDKDDVQAKVELHGGAVVGSVTKKCTHVISLFEEVSKKKQTQKLATAIKNNLPIVDATWVDHAIEKKSLEEGIDDFKVWKDGAAVDVDPDVKTKVKLASTERKKKRMAIPPVDKYSDHAEDGSILVDNDEVYGVMLNATDLSVGQSGRNSFYVLQIIKHNSKASKFYVFRRWGRVGQDGNTKEEDFGSKKLAIENFKEIFYERTGNHWEKYAFGEFEKKPGKLAPVDLDDGEEHSSDNEEELKNKKATVKVEGAVAVNKGPTLTIDKRVQDLVKLLFDTDMILGQMKTMNMNMKKIGADSGSPLGKLSKSQLKKGERILEQVEEELKKGDGAVKAKFQDFTNQFYTIIPQDFGTTKPPLIDNEKILQEKYELLADLADMEVAAAGMASTSTETELHPLQQQYLRLKNEVTSVDKLSEEWQRIETFLYNSKEHNKIKIKDVFRVDRQSEKEAFAKHDKLVERKLLWHGSKVAVFAAILSGGLKIMPHAGGRVGRGLYFADMISKSAQYLGLHGNLGLILLNEVALGKSNRINRDDSSLVKAPKGFDSVLATGTIMPDPKVDFEDKTLSHTGHPVVIPQGLPAKGVQSSTFLHNEYLVYDQTQVRMRYLLLIEFERGW